MAPPMWRGSWGQTEENGVGLEQVSGSLEVDDVHTIKAVYGGRKEA